MLEIVISYNNSTFNGYVILMMFITIVILMRFMVKLIVRMTGWIMGMMFLRMKVVIMFLALVKMTMMTRLNTSLMLKRDF